MKKILTRVLAATGLVAASLIPATLAAPTAGACGNTVTLGIGGFGGGNAHGVFGNRIDVGVGYSGNLGDIEGGVGALAATVNQVRKDCPSSHIQLAGYSQGAAIAHIYLSRHGLANGSAVLYADPKQAGTGESDGLFTLAGPPLAGTDANFRGVPTVSICYHNDIICNRGAASGWIGYLTGDHGRYDFSPKAHLGKTGVIWT